MRHSLHKNCSCGFCKSVKASLATDPSLRTVSSNSGVAVPPANKPYGKSFASSYSNMGVVSTELTASANARISKNPVGFHAKNGVPFRVDVPEARPDRLTVKTFTKKI